MKSRWAMEDIEKCFLGTAILYILTYMVVWRNGNLLPDYIAHTDWSIQLYTGELTLVEFLSSKSSYPLWHIVTYLLYVFGGIDRNMSAAMSTAFFNCFAYWSVNLIWQVYERNNKQKCNTWFWSFCLMVMGPLYWPRYTKYYYLGQGSGNTWHNPTNIAVKGIAVLAFSMIVYLVCREGNRKNYIFLGFLLVCSALAKPSFLQGIIPGFGLFFLLKLVGTKPKEKIKKYLKIFATFIPSMIAICIQFYISFFGEVTHSEGIGFSFGYVLGEYSLNLLYSFLIAFAFPCTVLIIDIKNMIKDTAVQIAYCYELCAYLESVMIYEKGRRLYHGNWLWGSYISMFIVWMVSLIKFCEYINNDEEFSYGKKIKASMGVGIFFLQVIFGYLYWYNITTGRMEF